MMYEAPISLNPYIKSHNDIRSYVFGDIDMKITKLRQTWHNIFDGLLQRCCKMSDIIPEHLPRDV